MSVIIKVPSSGGGGTGLTDLNGLTADPQYFATGTAGTNFNIVSAGDTHTFNIPVASATNTGKLSAANWTTFNSKLSSVSADLTPSLGGNLNASNFDITGIDNLTATTATIGTVDDFVTFGVQTLTAPTAATFPVLFATSDFPLRPSILGVHSLLSVIADLGSDPIGPRLALTELSGTTVLGSGELSYDTTAGLVISASAGVTVTSNANPIDLYTTTNTNQIFLDTTGNVGLSTATPAANLHVSNVVGSTVGLLVESTDNGTDGPYVNVYNNSATPADADGLGLLTFSGNNDAAVEKIYAGIGAIATDVSAGGEGGAFIYYLSDSSDGTPKPAAILIIDPAQGDRAHYAIGADTAVGGLLSLFSVGGAQQYFIRPSDSQASSVVMILPPDEGNSGDVLTTDGAGTTSWSAPLSSFNWATSEQVYPLETLNGSTLYAKLYTVANFPNTTTTNIAHGVTGLSTVYKLWATASDGTASSVSGTDNGATGDRFYVSRNGANLVLGSRFNATTYSGYVFMIYTKT